MAKRPDGSSDKTRVVSFTRDAADRIAKTVRAHEGGNRSGLPVRSYPRMSGEGGGPAVRLGKTSAEWPKGTLATIQLYESGTPPNEQPNEDPPYSLEDCVNKFADVACGKWVMVAEATNGYWYLIAAECD